MANLKELYNAGKYLEWFKFWTWKSRNNMGKMAIHFEERLKLFNYNAWRSRVKNQRLKESEQKGILRFGFVILDSKTGGNLTVNRNVLRRLDYSNWAAWHVSTNDCSDEEEIGEEWPGEWQDLEPLQGLQKFVMAAELDYVCFVESGDYFGADYLSRITSFIAQNEVDMVYCDEDFYLPPLGSLMQPFLKPDSSPSMLLSVNYLRHAFFHKTLVNRISSAAGTYESLREALAFSALQQGVKSLHITELIYHATECIHFSDKVKAERLADVRVNLENQGLKKVEAEISTQGQIHVSWQSGDPLVSIIIPTHNQAAMLNRMMNSLLTKTRYQKYEVVLVDNASDEDDIGQLYEKLLLDGRVRVIKETNNFNYSAYNNIGAAQANGEVLVFLNNDVEVVEPDWLTELVMWTERPNVGIVGARLMYPNGRIQHAGVIIGLVGSAGHVFIGERPEIETAFGSPMWYRNYLAVTGACMAMRREIFEELGGFDEAYQLTFSDITLCLKANEKGYQVVYNPFSSLIHHEGGTRGDHIPDTDIVLMAKELEKWVEIGDPYYNPLLSHLIATPALKRNFEESPVERLKKIVALAAINIPEKRVEL